MTAVTGEGDIGADAEKDQAGDSGEKKRPSWFWRRAERSDRVSEEQAESEKQSDPNRDEAEEDLNLGPGAVEGLVALVGLNLKGARLWLVHVGPHVQRTMP